ncbi:hypothetical protein [Agrobacterium pusense]|uniref:hypothetical protein n=1 Tax=Agrobacterium pusense TaxID=648995 RepID=UPI000882C04C|nr:hypothetical protein [Agrobacterium pusense]OOO15672.1 hypothetical protein BTE56_24325 [Agrobacterium pusense]WKD47144.1 hypothetical protein M8C82_13975 [Agrobacterium pusense]SDF16148.1 hypothetical protein SAMN05421750_1081 [Agrobacterium pusense]
MNGWGFAAAIVQSIASMAWPGAIISVVWILKDDIRRLLPYAHLKVGENELSFAKHIQEAIDQARLSEATNEAHSSEIDLGATRSLENVPDDALRQKVLECVTDMRKMSFKFNSERNSLLHRERSEDNFSDYTNEIIGLHDRQRLEFQTTLFPMARALHEQLLKRLNERGVDASSDRGYDFVFEHGSLAGPNPLDEAALRLEELARLLG